MAGETGVAAGQAQSDSDFDTYREAFVSAGEEKVHSIPCYAAWRLPPHPPHVAPGRDSAPSLLFPYATVI